MARKHFTEVREVPAVEITVLVEELDDYMSAWLAICNNARTYKDRLLKVSNNSKTNHIDLLVVKEAQEEGRRFLSQFGEITEEIDTVAVVVDVFTEYDDFDADYVHQEVAFGYIG